MAVQRPAEGHTVVPQCDCRAYWWSRRGRKADYRGDGREEGKKRDPPASIKIARISNIITKYFKIYLYTNVHECLSLFSQYHDKTL